MACSDILTHLCNQIPTGQTHHPRRFSLYLSSQLMFGSAKIFQKQLEYLLADVTALFRKFHPESSVTHDIDLMPTRPELFTLESCVPTSFRDKHFNIFFGSCKDPHVDVDFLMDEMTVFVSKILTFYSKVNFPFGLHQDQWDSAFIRMCHPLTLDLPAMIKPELGSPNSVSDPKEIQIIDQEITLINPMMPREEDLLPLNIEDLDLLQQPEVPPDVPIDESKDRRTSTSLYPMGSPDAANADIQSRLPAFEETPTVIPAADLPTTPQKAKRQKRPVSPRGKKKKGAPKEGDEGPVTVQHEGRDVIVSERDGSVPEGGSDDWCQRRPLLLLSPVTVTESPHRKRRVQKLLIDETLQLMRSEIKANMLTHGTTSQTLMLPSVSPKDHFNDPGCIGHAASVLTGLWRRNCKFGLKTVDAPTNIEEVTSPLDLDPVNRKRHSQVELWEETPSKSARLEISAPPSIERARDISALSASFGQGKRSHSTAGLVSDDSATNISGRKHSYVSADNDRSGGEGQSFTEQVNILNLGVLPSWPEEQELLVSPVPLPEAQAIPAEVTPPPVQSPEQNIVTPQTKMLNLVRSGLRMNDDWTTFRTICPPADSDRKFAAELFMALCSPIIHW